MTMNMLDIAVCLILAFFAVRGLLRGFAKEVLGLVGLIGGLWVAYTYYPVLAQHLSFFKAEVWRNLLAYIMLFLGVNVMTGILAHVLHQVLAWAFLAWLDKLCGAAIGLIKGIFLCAIIVTVGQYFFAENVHFTSSAILPHFNRFLEFVQTHIPQDIFRF